VNPLLLIMNPRRIVECVESIGRLPIDQAWLTGYTEFELTALIEAIIRDSDYSHYLICSDDGVIPEFALESVVERLDDHPVVTGYSNLDAVDWRVNLTKTPFQVTSHSVMEDYDLYHVSDVWGWPDELVPTYFAGFALTGMSREMWQKYPYTSIGNPSDYSLCVRLQKDGVPIVAPKQACMWHAKEVINQEDQEARKRVLVGQIEPVVTMRTGVLA